MAQVKKRGDYSKGTIYKIVNDIDDKIYIGSTTQPLHKRFYEHKKNATILMKDTEFCEEMRKKGVGHFKILLIEYYPCENKGQLEAKEYEIKKTFPKERVWSNEYCRRGIIYYDEAHDRYVFKQHKNKKQIMRSFSLSEYETLEKCYIAAIEFQDELEEFEKEREQFDFEKEREQIENDN